MQRISTTGNALVKRFRALARGGRSPHVLLDGEHLLDEALRSGLQVEVVAFAARAGAPRSNGLADRAQRTGAQLFSVSDNVMSAMSPVRQPSGVVAIARRPDSSLGDALSRAPQLVLMLSDVQDPGNVGAIIRAAEACGATGVVVAGRSADPFSWKALRGSMGSTFRLPVASGVELPEVAGEARSRGLRLLAAVPRGGTPLPDANLRAPAAIVIGGEGGGLPPDVVADADERITIPMAPAVESLNVATAAALIAYEASRQRGSQS
jgi:TrmH family RNA methyltransferase